MHRHTEQTIYDKMSVAPLCTIQTKHIITGQDSTITTEWCATFMVINVLFYVFVLWICAFDQHTSVSAQVYTRGTQSSLNQWQSHTLSSPLSAFHSLKTDVHADRPVFHPSTRWRRRRCPSSTTLPASQHTTKTKTPRQAQQCVMCLAHNTLILPGPRLSSTLPQACIGFGSLLD